MTDALTSNMLGAAVGLGAAGLALNSLKVLPKINNSKKKKRKKITFVSNKKIIKTGVTTMVGIGLLSGAAGMVNKL